MTSIQKASNASAKIIRNATIAALTSLALIGDCQAIPILRQENPEQKLKKAAIYACSTGRIFAYSSEDYSLLILQEDGSLKGVEQTINHPEYGTDISINKTKKSFFGQPSEIVHENFMSTSVTGINGDLVPWEQIYVGRFSPKSLKINWIQTTYEAPAKGKSLEIIAKTNGVIACNRANYPFKPKAKEFGDYLLQVKDFKRDGIKSSFSHLSDCREESLEDRGVIARSFKCTSGFLTTDSPVGSETCEVKDLTWTRQWTESKKADLPPSEKTIMNLTKGRCILR